MLRRVPGGAGAARVALLALVSMLIGAGLWLAAGDDRSPATTRLEATQTSVDPLLGRATATPWDGAAPATPAPGGTPPTSGSSGGAPAAGAGATSDGPATTDTPAPGGPAGGLPAGGLPAVVGRADSIDGGVGGGAGSTADSDSPAPAPALGTAPTETGAARSSADASGGASSPASASTADDSPTTTEQTTTSRPSTPTTRATTTTTPALTPSASRSRNSAAEAEVVPLTNRDRTAAGLGTLARNGCLDAAASGFAEQMARSGVLAHNSGAGGAVLGCRPGAAWGDNVGTAKPCDTALLEEEWMDSPSHRRNILTGDFRLIGVGAWTDDKGACWVQVLFSS